MDNAQLGILILDGQGRIVYSNRWVQERAQGDAQAWVGKTVVQVFPVLAGGYFETALKGVIQTGFPSFLANSLHPSPLPLFQSAQARSGDSRIKHSVHILPMGGSDAQAAGQSYVLIQINDMTQAVNRERLLKTQATALHGIARADALTGIGNRRHFDEVLALQMREASRAHSTLSLILLDIDHFKFYNDTYGHVKGDEALQLVAQAVRSACHRTHDTAARYGGEEFALILPHTNLEGACTVASEMQQKVKALNLVHAQNLPSQLLTISVGVVSLSVSALETAKTTIELADVALYRAKQSGRNSIFIHDGKDVAQFVSA